MTLVKRKKGFTLVEILIAMVIASLLMLSVVRIFTRIGDTFKINADALQLMETTRVALRFVKSDLIQAGYMGCLYTDRDIVDYSELEKDLSSLITGLSHEVKGVSGVDGGGVNPDELNLFYQQDLDVRVLLMDTKGNKLGGPALAVDPTNLYNDAGDLIVQPGDWLTVANCAKATSFILTNDPVEITAASVGIDSNVTGNGNVATLEYKTGISYNGYSNSGDTLTLMDSGKYGFLASGGAAMVSKFVHVQYVVENSQIDGGATQSLFRKVNGEASATTNEIVRLVEDFQVTYGIDDDGDGVADDFVSTFDESDQKAVVVKVEIEISDGTRTEELINIVKLRNKGL